MNSRKNSVFSVSRFQGSMDLERESSFALAGRDDSRGQSRRASEINIDGVGSIEIDGCLSKQSRQAFEVRCPQTSL